MPQNPALVNAQGSSTSQLNHDHQQASKILLAMLTRPGQLERVRDRLEFNWVHSSHARMFRALQELPPGTEEPLKVLPTDKATELATSTMDVEVPVSTDTALSWLAEAWNKAEMDKALRAKDPARIAELYQLQQAKPQDKPKLQAHSIEDILSREIPPRSYVAEPIIPTQGLVQLYAPRGIGKTYVALDIGLAVSTGGQALRWAAPEPRRVLYLDGEMPAVTMQERLAALSLGLEQDPPSPDYFRIITPDLQELAMPDLATPAGQAAVAPLIKDADLVVIDNLSTLCRHGKENEGEAWLPVQGWILELRRQGKSVLLVHHAGKSGQQRGTSRREDVLDTVISLRRPKDYEADQGARVEIHLDKARGIVGDQARPFEAQLVQDGHALKWTTRDLAQVEEDMVQRLLDEGLSIRDIRDETGMHRSKVARIKKKLQSRTG